MKVMKFGGTSVGDAARILEVGRLTALAAISTEGAPVRIGLVVSAVTGVTNRLIASVDGVLQGRPVDGFIEEFTNIHAGIIADLAAAGIDQDLLASAEREIVEVTSEFENLLTGIRLLQECSPGVHDHISSLGERASTPLVAAVLAGRGLFPRRLDPRAFLLTDSVFGNASPIMEEIDKRLADIRASTASEDRVMLMPGFFGADIRGKITTLGRGGSDFSAAILAAGLHADRLEIWTDVDGIFSADPRMVADAFVLDEISYAEAMELAFFGAKVLHPRTIAPVVARGIPTVIKNSFNPDHPGTLIHASPPPSERPVRGLSTLSGVSMIGLSGAGLRGVPGVAARVFSAMAQKNISVILIAQSSSEYSICFCVATNQRVDAVNALEHEFILERGAGLVNPIESVGDLSILSVVGDEMRSRRGIAGIFFGALADADVNVIAISQGFSERNISTVIAAPDTERAMRIVHHFFFNTRQAVQVFLVGSGAVGGRLLEQIRMQQVHLAAQQVDVRVCGIASKNRMLLDFGGITLDTWKKRLSEVPDTPFELLPMLTKISSARLLNPVLVDCTDSGAIAKSYEAIFEAGLHVVTPNKKANSADRAYYRSLRKTANRRRRQFLYETNVGAGLPIIETLKNLIKSGDRLRICRGILSGSLSYVFGRLEDGVPFSQALEEARSKGFTEPDPRDDLSGLDVARKCLILAREVGFNMDLSDVVIDSPIPAGFDLSGPIDNFLNRCRDLDAHFATRVAEARKLGMALRFVGTIADGGCRVGLANISASEALFQVRDGENAVSFLTDRYTPIPLTVRGYGAGPDVTAAGVFADLLRTVFWNTEVL
ncbi:MAG: bifunctional aspartate kinase/homoserine dehydrogenase I [Candidatus Riflebacteria bacterium]|nr:bifunctional aspartate kinase/homoserine dehydrogenase I [Candidatus Riflebacteria bacterium]